MLLYSNVLSANPDRCPEIWLLQLWSAHFKDAKTDKLTLPVFPITILKHPDSRIHGANMGPTWVLSAPDGPHFGPMNLAIREPL